MQSNSATSPASVKLPVSLRERIKNLADARNQSAHAIMLQTIENYVDREEKREALRQEANAAHEHYVQTGLHLHRSTALHGQSLPFEFSALPTDAVI